MIFLSAQPDDKCFVLNIELQLNNFKKFKISKKNIHILVGYDRRKKINHNYIDLAKRYNEFALFYFYPDERTDKRYALSIRPHIISQHFSKFQYLTNESIFYHDPGMLFIHALPNFHKLEDGEECYCSNTNSNLSNKHLVSENGSMDTLTKMCKTFSIGDASTFIQSDKNTWCTPALLKKIPASFWGEVEKKSVAFFLLIEMINKKNNAIGKRAIKNIPPISIWHAEMWALVWLLSKIKAVKTSQELNFFNIDSSSNHWQKNKIFYSRDIQNMTLETCVDSENIRAKIVGKINFDYGNSNYYREKITKEIEDLERNALYDAKDVTFIVPIRIDSEDRLNNLRSSLAFIAKHFKTNVIVLEADNEQKIFNLQSSVEHVFINDINPVFLREMYNNIMIRMAETKIVIKYDCDIIVPPSQLYESILKIRHNKSKMSYPYDGRFINVDGCIKTAFTQDLDISILHKYINSDYKLFQRSVGGCIVINRSWYIKIGMDNEHFIGWGFEDQECLKRANILDANVSRVEGVIYHLEHSRGMNSTYHNSEEMLNSHKEYVLVSNMSKNQLKKYINTWSWTEKMKS